MKAKTFILACLIFLAALSIRLIYVQQMGFAFTPDALEYLSLGRNLAEGHGYLLGIKFHYFRNFPVLHPGWGDRPPLYPLLLALLFKLGGSAATVLRLNLLFPAASTAACYLVLRRLTRGHLVPLLGALLFTLNPWVLKNSLGAHSEQPCFLLTFIYILCFPAADSGWRRWAGCGVISGLAVLLRGNGILLLVPPLLYLIYLFPLDLRRKAFALLIPFVLLWAIIPFNSWRSHGEAFYDIHKSHYCLSRYDMALWQGYGYAYPSSWDYVRGHWREIIPAWGQNTLKYLVDLVNPWLLSVFTPLLLFIPGTGRGTRQTAALLLLAFLNLAAVISFWSVYAPRFLIYLIALLLPVALRAGASFATGCRYVVFLGFLLIVLVAWTAKDIRETMPYQDRVSHGPHSAVVYASLPGLLAAETAGPIAATDPWIVNFLTRQPAALIPELRDRATLDRWLAEHAFTHIVLDLAYTPYGRIFQQRWLPLLLAEHRAELVHQDNRIIILRLTPTPR